MAANEKQTPDGIGEVLSAYRAKVAAEALSSDPAQVAVANALDDVLEDLAEKRTGIAPFLRRRAKREKTVRGLYIWGAVGRGKTMLMDLFFTKVPLAKKRRAHFNDFMEDVHDRIARLRAEQAADAVTEAADEIAAAARVLCFDEFAVTDIADAMILSRLFARLFEQGVTLIATSNVAPTDLYEGGLNRQLFLPFIRLLREHVAVIQLDADVDYRLDRLTDREVWFAPGDPGFDRLWTGLMGDRTETEVAVKVASRTITAPRAAGGLARFTFAELCEAPLGTNDHLAIARRFHTIFVETIPVMNRARRETLRRFIGLIDILYDQKVRLVATAAAEPDKLFDASGGGADGEAFAFARTASRLHEMRSAGYLADVEGPPLT